MRMRGNQDGNVENRGGDEGYRGGNERNQDDSS